MWEKNATKYLKKISGASGFPSRIVTKMSLAWYVKWNLILKRCPHILWVCVKYKITNTAPTAAFLSFWYLTMFIFRQIYCSILNLYGLLFILNLCVCLVPIICVYFSVTVCFIRTEFLAKYLCIFTVLSHSPNIWQINMWKNKVGEKQNIAWEFLMEVSEKSLKQKT